MTLSDVRNEGFVIQEIPNIKEVWLRGWGYRQGKLTFLSGQGILVSLK